MVEFSKSDHYTSKVIEEQVKFFLPGTSTDYWGTKESTPQLDQKIINMCKAWDILFDDMSPMNISRSFESVSCVHNEVSGM